jgi:hypothetical protein
MWSRLIVRLREDAEMFARSLVQESPEVRHLAQTRLSDYQPDGHRSPFDCPYCWIVDGIRSPLQPMSGPRRLVSCSSCASEYEPEFDLWDNDEP